MTRHLFMATAVSLVVMVASKVDASQIVGPGYPPPNGVTLSDSGDAGRAGGRTWGFSAVDLTGLFALYWGPSSPIQMALDGVVDSPGETLTFSAFTSTSAVWEGTSTIHLAFGGPTPAYSRLALGLSGSAVFADVGSIGISNGNAVVASVTGDFAVNLLFEASLDGVSYAPVLDLVDGLSTVPPTSGGGAITNCASGYWWEIPEPGDLNCDGRVDVDDIDPFVLALTDATGYAALYPACDRFLADLNGDGRPDGGDVQAFVAALLAP